MRNDPHITINISLAAAWAQALGFITRHWKALLATWVLTNLLSSVAYTALYPPWAGLPAEVSSLRYAVYVVTTSIIGAAGFVFVVHLTGAAAAGQERSDYGTVLDESVRQLGRYITTVLLCFLRVVLWGLMAVPLLMLLALVGLDVQAAPGATLLFSAPVMILMALAFVRFGWGLYFTIINQDTPLYAMYHGQSMYLNNRRVTWLLAAVVFLVPGFLPLADAFDIGGLGHYVHPAAYAASAWSYVASVFATMVISRTEPAGTGEAAIDRRTD